MANILGFLKKGYPFLAAGLSVAGPVGNLAASILGKVLSVENPTPETVTKALEQATLTPDQQAALQQGEQQYQAQLQAMGFQHVEEVLALQEEDRASARNMQIQTRSKLPAYLAAAAVVTLLACIALLAFVNLPASGRDAILILLGAVVASYKDVYGYVFGSSAGSAEKTAALTQIAAHQ